MKLVSFSHGRRGNSTFVAARRRAYVAFVIENMKTRTLLTAAECTRSRRCPQGRSQNSRVDARRCRRDDSFAARGRIGASYSRRNSPCVTPLTTPFWQAAYQSLPQEVRHALAHFERANAGNSARGGQRSSRAAKSRFARPFHTPGRPRCGALTNACLRSVHLTLLSSLARSARAASIFSFTLAG